MRRSWVQLALLASLIAVAAYVADRKRPSPELETLQSSPATANAPDNKPQGFDFYVLALSWSPSYCEMKGRDADAEQCGARKPIGFTVHGLWPQYERGFPRDCAVGEPGGVDRAILRDIEDIMPSDGLARHEWRKHGACSGLSPQAYFKALTGAFAKIRIPDSYLHVDAKRSVAPKRVEADFLTANAGLPANGFAAICDGGYFTEVRICMTKDLTFRPCAQVDKNACRAASVSLPPMK
jgi:ribonuclease T2